METETACAKLTKFTPNRGDDLPYNIPQEVLINILSQLPTRNVVRTSILSSRWRNQWKFLSDVHIRFDDFMRTIDCSNIETRRSTEASIKKFLSSFHSSKIRKFHILMPFSVQFDIKELLNFFVNFSMDRAVEDLVAFNCYRSLKFTFPGNIFQISSLSRLCLSGVQFDVPLLANLPFLKTLILCSMRICAYAVESLIPEMPSLKNLTLDTCYGGVVSINHSILKHLAVQSEMSVRLNTIALKFLVFTDPPFTGYGKGNDNVFEDVSSLIRCEIRREISSSGRESFDWKAMLDRLHHVKTIQIGHQCIEDLSGYAWHQPLSLCSSLVLEISLSAKGDILGSVAKILPFFVRIKKITFMTKKKYGIHQAKELEYQSWTSLEQAVSNMQHVKEAEVNCVFTQGSFDFHQPEQLWWAFDQNSKLVEILLRNLRNLEKFTFCVGKAMKFASSTFLLEFLSRLEGIKHLPKASPIATVNCSYS